MSDFTARDVALLRKYVENDRRASEVLAGNDRYTTALVGALRITDALEDLADRLESHVAAAVAPETPTP